jgi:hypothetical protein
MLAPAHRSIGRIPLDIRPALEKKDGLPANLITVVALMMTGCRVVTVIEAPMAAVPASLAAKEELGPAMSNPRETRRGWGRGRS